MKKWILMLLALVLCGMTQAQNAEVTLNNGTFVKGDIEKFSFNVDNYHEFRIKKTDGEKADFASTDVKEIKYYNKKAGEWENWIPMVAQMGLSMSYKKRIRNSTKIRYSFSQFMRGKTFLPIFTI